LKFESDNFKKKTMNNWIIIFLCIYLFKNYHDFI
jgi:hypothetical protein